MTSRVGEFTDGVCSAFDELMANAVFGPYLTNVKSLIMAVASLAAEALNADAGSIWLVRRSSLVRAVIINRPVDLFGAFTMSLREGLAGTVVRCGKPVISDDVQSDGRFVRPEFAQREGLITYLGCPILVGSKCIGMVCLFRKKREKFTESDVRMLSTITDILGLAIHHCSTTQGALDQWCRLLASFPELLLPRERHAADRGNPVRPVWILDSSLPKGLHPLTLAKVRELLATSRSPVSAQQACVTLQLSKATARRYLAHLAECGEAERALRYSRVGRPSYFYSLSRSGGEGSANL